MKLLILSDIHGNWPALEAVLEAKARGTMSPSAVTSWITAPTLPTVYTGSPNTPSSAFAATTTTPWLSALIATVSGLFREASLATRTWHRTLLTPDDLAFLPPAHALVVRVGGKAFPHGPRHAAG